MGEAIGNILDPSLFWEYRVTLLAGFLQNIAIFVSAGIVATGLAFLIGLARLSRHSLLRMACTAYAELFRNTPEFILLIWIYYVAPVVLSRLLAEKMDLSPYLASVLALGFAYSGFMSETVRTGLLSVPHGHVEAALSIGMPRRAILFRIVVPQAARRMLPEALNQYVSLFKATSIVSLIAVEDVMYRVSMINADEMQPMPLYTGVALLYCLIIIAATQLVQRLSDGWRRRGWV